MCITNYKTNKYNKLTKIVAHILYENKLYAGNDPVFFFIDEIRDL